MKSFRCTLLLFALLSGQAYGQVAGAPLAPKDSAVDMSLAGLEAAAAHLKGGRYRDQAHARRGNF